MLAKTLYIILGFLIGTVGLHYTYALSSTELKLIETEQTAVLKQTGSYFTDHKDPKITLNTYETICKGYYIIETTPDNIIYTGYGDLKNQYTYTIPNENKFTKSTTTPPLTDVLITDIPITTDKPSTSTDSNRGLQSDLPLDL